MLVIFKNALRTFFKKKSQVFVILGLIVFVGFYFSVFLNSVLPTYNKFERDKSTYNVEQFRFCPRVQLDNTELASLSAEYKMTAEDLATLSAQELSSEYKIELSQYVNSAVSGLSHKDSFSFDEYHYKNIIDGQNLFNVTFYTGKIDQNVITEGAKPLKNDELALGIGYAKSNKINVGDKIKLEGKSFTVSGLFYSLANTYVYDATNSKSALAKNNAAVLMTAQAYSAVKSADNVVYLGRFDENVKANDISAKIQKMNESGDFSYLMASSDTTNVSMFEKTLQSQLSMMYFGSVLIFVVTAVFLSMFITEYIKKSRKQFGTMLIMGYKKRQIVLSHIYFLFLFLPLALIGTLLGYMGRSMIIGQFSLTFNYPVDQSGLQLGAILIFSIFYAIFICLFIFFSLYRALSGKPLDLMMSRKKLSGLRFVEKIRNLISKLPFKQRIKYSFAFSRISRFLIMTAGVFISLILINLALSLYSGYNQGVQTFESDTSFRQIANYNTVKTLSAGESYDGKFIGTTGFLSDAGGKKINKTIDIEFVDLKTLPINFKIDTSKKGIIIPIRYKYLNNVVIGDTIVIKGSNGSLTEKVIGFSELSVNNTFYAPISLISDYNLALKSTSYNGEYLKTPYSGSDAAVSLTDKSSLIRQIRELQQSGSTIIMILIIFSVLMALFIINNISGSNISDNIQGITIMLMSGYKKKTVSSFLLNVYNMAIVIGAAFSIVVLPGLLRILTTALNTSEAGFIQLSFNWFNFSCALMAVAAFYYVSLFIVRKRYLKMNIREVMSED